MKEESVPMSFLIRVIQIVHYAVVIFMCFAWILPSSSVWVTHIVLVPVMIIHWKTNNNRCFLTDLENKLKGIDPSHPVEGQFIKRVLGMFLPKVPGDQTVELITYAVMFGSAGISMFRLLS